MDFRGKHPLGSTGLLVGKLGISSSFGAPSEAYEEAFEQGCNYFLWGTFVKGRSSALVEAVANIRRQGKRDELVLSMPSYAHQPQLTTFFLERGLRRMKLDYADVLLLGYYSSFPPRKIVDGALKLKERGLVRYLGITSHNRDLLARLAGEKIFDILHVRYNAAHPGAEADFFPLLPERNRPGIVSFTATAWGKLLKKNKMPPGERPLTPAQCYRFVLSNPRVDVCMMGAANTRQMRENLQVLDTAPLEEAEEERLRRIGAYLHG